MFEIKTMIQSPDEFEMIYFFLFRGNIEQPIETPSKRDCAGFPCMYTHLSAKAGRASLYRKLARLIDDCISDLNCNPGWYIFKPI